MLKKHLIFLLAICWLPTALSAEYEKGVSVFHPELGIWGGPAAPLGPLADRLETSLGLGIFARIDFPSENLRLEAGAEYFYFRSRGTSSLDLVPLYLGLAYNLPINFPIKFKARLDLASVYLNVFPERKQGFLPGAIAGAEVNFPAGKQINLGLHMDYIFVYEGLVAAPRTGYTMINGGFAMFGVLVSMNLDL